MGPADAPWSPKGPERLPTVKSGPDDTNAIQVCPRRMGADLNADVVWVAMFCSDKIAKIDTNTHQVTQYEMPYKYSRPYGMQVDRDHNVWINETNTDMIAEFNPTPRSLSNTNCPPAVPTCGGGVQLQHRCDVGLYPVQPREQSRAVAIPKSFRHAVVEGFRLLALPFREALASGTEAQRIAPANRRHRTSGDGSFHFKRKDSACVRYPHSEIWLCCSSLLDEKTGRLPAGLCWDWPFLIAAITFTVRWRPFIGPRARDLTHAKI